MGPDHRPRGQSGGHAGLAESIPVQDGISTIAIGYLVYQCLKGLIACGVPVA